MKKPLISLIGLIIVIAVAATVMGFALGGGSGSPAQDPTGEITHGDPTYDEWLSDFGDGKVLTSADDIDPNVCNVVHNINACSPEELEASGALTEIAWEETHGKTEPGVKGEVVVTSIDDIDPNVCNVVHNINACSPEELEASGALTDETGEDIEVEPGSEYGDTEPLLVDGEPGYTVQPVDEAVIEDCSLAGGTVYVTSEGELGCEVVHDLEDDSDELVTFSQPPTIEPQPVPAPR